MTIFRVQHNKNYTVINNSLIQDPRLSFEGKGIYGMLEAGAIEIKDVPENIIKELIEVGYLEEVK